METNTTTHTPGPWIFHDRTRSKDNRIMVLHPDGERLIADTGQGCSSPTRGPIPKEEREANARLIAAAPDLLEALELVQFWMKFNTPCPLGEIDRAIAKAKGEQSAEKQHEKAAMLAAASDLLNFVENVVQYGALRDELDGRKAVALLQRVKPESDALR